MKLGARARAVLKAAARDCARANVAPPAWLPRALADDDWEPIEEEILLARVDSDGTLRLTAHGMVGRWPWGFSAESVDRIVRRHDPPRVVVALNSPGGLATEGAALYGYLTDLRRSGVALETRGFGLVASAATFPLLAAPEPGRSLAVGTTVLIHEVEGFLAVAGPARDIRAESTAMLADMASMNGNLAAIYEAALSGVDQAEARRLMRSATLLTAAEASALGFGAVVDAAAAPRPETDPEPEAAAPVSTEQLSAFLERLSAGDRPLDRYCEAEGGEG